MSENIGQSPESPQEYLDRLREDFDSAAARLSVLAAHEFVGDPRYAAQLSNGFTARSTKDAEPLNKRFSEVVGQFTYGYTRTTAHANPEVPALIRATDAAGAALSEALLSGDCFTGEMKAEFLYEQAEYDPEAHRRKRLYGMPDGLYESIVTFSSLFSEEASNNVLTSFSNVFTRVSRAYVAIQQKAPTSAEDSKILLNELLVDALGTSRLSQPKLDAAGGDDPTLSRIIAKDGAAHLLPEPINWRSLNEDITELGDYVEIRDQIFSRQGCPSGNARFLQGTDQLKTTIEVLWPWAVEQVIANLAPDAA